MTSQIKKQSETLTHSTFVLDQKPGLLCFPNKKFQKSSFANSKTAFERQRENASKLASGRSVVSRENKENCVPFKKPINLPSKVTEKTKRPLESRINVIHKSQEQLIKPKDKFSAISKAEILPRSKTISICKEEIKVPTSVAVPKKQSEKDCSVRECEAKKEDKVEVKQEEKAEDKKAAEDESVAPAKEEPAVESVVVVESEDKIPPGVTVIDADEAVENSEYLLGVYAQDIYKFLRHLERSQTVKENYISQSHRMTEHMRALLVDWIFEVQKSLKLLNETAHLSIALLDRFMQDHPGIVKEELQLVAVTCIFLASKYEEIFPPDVDDLVDMCADTYTKFQILNMEKTIFSALDFQMGRPLPSHFLRRYGRAGRIDAIAYAFSKYFTDLGLVSYALCHVHPSLLAAASVYLSLYITSDDADTEVWTPTLAYYSQYSFKDIKPVVTKLASIVVKAPESAYKTVPKKYLDPKTLHSVSARSELKSEKLHILANECETRL